MEQPLRLQEVADEQVPANKYEDRCQIYALSKRGSSQESIAEVLGVSQSGQPEIHRNRGERGYRFKQAEAKAQARQAIRSKPRKLTVPTRSKIEAKLRQMRWSPEQISGWLSEQGIKLSHERIYQMIWYDKRDGGTCGAVFGGAENVITGVPARTPDAALSGTSSQREQTSLRFQVPRLPRSNVCSTQDLENPSASVHLKRFSTPSLTLKFLCAAKLNPRYLAWGCY